MTFNELNLSAPLLRAVAEAGYESPSPIQASAIPPVLAGRDLMGCAQTGTGKTAAFALPMLDRLTAAPAKKKGAVRALILTPTRELALQIGESFELYGKYLNQRSTVIFGGVGQAPQVAALKKGVDILIACPGRLNEERATNHYNCPVVAYYPELLKANVSALADFDFMMPYFELADKKRFTKHAVKYFCGKYPQIKKKQVIAAVEDAYMAQDEYYIDVRIEGQRAIRYADEHDLDVAVIAGRPYHVDPEINHGIDQLIASFGLVIVSEDAVWQLTDAPEVHVLNQWTYHSRMYGAAKYVTQKENAQLIQLVSFGCGIDAITTDEMRAICENGGKIYTQLKIDEISNLGAAKIRIRSMLAAVEEGRKLAEQQNA